MVCDPRMVRLMEAVAKTHNIPTQREVPPAGGTDTGSLRRAGRKGAIAGAISMPGWHIHRVIELCDEGDVWAGVRLVAEVVAGGGGIGGRGGPP